jgi:hypothetical protein
MTTIIRNAAPEKDNSDLNCAENKLKKSGVSVVDFTQRKKISDYEKAKERLLKAGSALDW